MRKVPDSLPKWIEPWQYWLLYRFANGMRGYYGAPVYLVGSILRKRNYRDVDIRIELKDEDFKARFGDVYDWEKGLGTGNWTKVNWKWSDECVKRTKEGWAETHMYLDFQIYPKNHCVQYKGKKKVKLDTR